MVEPATCTLSASLGAAAAASNTAVRMPSRPSAMTSSQVARKLREVRPHHHAEIWRRRRRPMRAGWANQALAVVGVVSAMPSAAETGRLDRLARRVGRQENASSPASAPTGRDSAARRRSTATTSKVANLPPRLQHPADLAIEPRPVRDVHRHMLQTAPTSKLPVRRTEASSALAVSNDTCPALAPCARSDSARRPRKAQLRSTPVTRQPIGRGQKARGPADAGADVQNRHASGDPGQIRASSVRSQRALAV